MSTAGGVRSVVEVQCLFFQKFLAVVFRTGTLGIFLDKYTVASADATQSQMYCFIYAVLVTNLAAQYLME